jgi:hypothetical protein
MHPEHPRLRRPLAHAISILDGKLRLASLPLACSAGRLASCIPYATEADKRSPRAWPSASLLDLDECRTSLDEVSVAGEWYDD